MRRGWTGWVWAFAGAWGAAFASAQTDDLGKLRDEHEKSVAAAARMVDDVYRLTLHQLERDRAEAGDYEGAQRVKSRLDALERSPAAPPTVVKPSTLTLVPGRAQTRDGANTDGSRQYIDFKKSGGKAVWDLLSIEPGLYDVIFTYSVGLPKFDPELLDNGGESVFAMPGGVIGFGELTSLNTAAGPVTLQRKVATTGSWDNFVRERIGRYEFKSKSASVRVEAVSALPGGLLHLKQVDLVKVTGAGGPAGAPPEDLGKALRELQKKSQQAVVEATAGLRNRFAGEFERLQQELTVSGDHAGAATVARESQRLLKDGSETPEPETKRP